MQIENSRNSEENTYNQEHYQHAPGCQRWKPEGGHVPGGPGESSTAPALVPIFIYELALKLGRLLTDGARTRSRAEESGN